MCIRDSPDGLGEIYKILRDGIVSEPYKEKYKNI